MQAADSGSAKGVPLALPGTASGIPVAPAGGALASLRDAALRSWNARSTRAAYSGIIRAASSRPCCLIRAAQDAFSDRAPLPAAHGLCSCQSWMTRAPSSPSRKPTVANVCTKTPSSPSQSTASSMSSSDMPDRSPSLRCAAAHRNRHTSRHPAPAPSRRTSFLVFGWEGRPVERRASVATGRTSVMSATKCSRTGGPGHATALIPPRTLSCSMARTARFMVSAAWLITSTSFTASSSCSSSGSRLRGRRRPSSSQRKYSGS
ncbi:hypothetical protein SAMN04489710_11833 [Paracidovorax konjaci]|uniref:Uncharacterized protein n=1 Tax=Paracidovorax konjaci TaxID=32040 RepID=A0A1I1YK20_9BURK|nr:hypothetical protein SAMN04489710_11833 [Paracidovorax konjaci]